METFEKIKVGQYYDTEVYISVIVILGIEMCPASPGGYNPTKVQERRHSEVPYKHEVSCKDEDNHLWTANILLRSF